MLFRSEEGQFRLLATTLDADPFLGRILTGRIRSGSVKPGQSVKALSREGELVENFRISKVLAFRGLERQPVDSGEAGDIVSLAGMTEATVANTICDPSINQPMFAQPIDPPTLSMTFRINDGPLAGTEGDKVQSRVIRDRLMREAEGNVALRVTDSDDKDAYEVAGRGELQLGILIENMRREGFELTIGKPRVVFRTGPDGERLEPIEEVIIDVDDEHSGVVVQRLTETKGDLVDMRPSGTGRQHPIALSCTTRFRTRAMSNCSGTSTTSKPCRRNGTTAMLRGKRSEHEDAVLLERCSLACMAVHA